MAKTAVQIEGEDLRAAAGRLDMPEIDTRTIEGEIDRFRSLGPRRIAQRMAAAPPQARRREISRDLFVLALGYRLHRGGLAKSVRRKLQTMAKALRTRGEVCSAPSLRLKPGARLVREWGGRTHAVTVTEDGFRIRRDELFLPHQDRPDDHRGGMVRPPLLRAAGFQASKIGKARWLKQKAARPGRDARSTREKSSEEGLDQTFNSLDAQRESLRLLHPLAKSTRAGCRRRRSTTTAAIPAARWSGRL